MDLFSTETRNQLLYDLFLAYYDARRNKRNTNNALSFELHYESSLIHLCDDIFKRNYQPRRSIAFIVNKPVKREVFAADFRDRIVHHLIFNYIAPVFEKRFVNDSYSCRTGKGTHYGIQRVDHFIRSCSENYHKDCYILKMDIQGYFMSIDRLLLYDIVVVHPDQDYLKTVIPAAREYLMTNLMLQLHPRKIYLQHYTKGVVFLGAVIKP